MNQEILKDKQQQVYICTRPTLASALIAEGFTFKKVPNPWQEHLNAWSFDMTRDLAVFVAHFYGGIGRAAPASVRRYLADQDFNEQVAGVER